MTEDEATPTPAATKAQDARPTLVLSLAPSGALEVEKHSERPLPTVQQTAAMAALFHQDVCTLALAQTVTALFHQAAMKQAQAAGSRVVLPKRSLSSLKKGRLS